MTRLLGARAPAGGSARHSVPGDRRRSVVADTRAASPDVSRERSPRSRGASSPFAVPASYWTSGAGPASSSGARCSSSSQRNDATNSGGPRAGHCAGASLGKVPATMMLVSRCPAWASSPRAMRIAWVQEKYHQLQSDRSGLTPKTRRIATCAWRRSPRRIAADAGYVDVSHEHGCLPAPAPRLVPGLGVCRPKTGCSIGIVLPRSLRAASLSPRSVLPSPLDERSRITAPRSRPRGGRRSMGTYSPGSGVGTARQSCRRCRSSSRSPRSRTSSCCSSRSPPAPSSPG